MKEPEKYPFLKWGQFKSKNPNKPDVLKIKVLDTKTSENQYGVYVLCLINGKKMNMTLHSFNSLNKQLFVKWAKAVKKGKIKKGTKFNLKTWLGISKNKRPIRRFDLDL